MKVIISRADGGISVMPLEGEFHSLLAVAPAELIFEPEIRKWIGAANPEWLPIKGWRLSDEALPDRTFRNAWTDNGSAIVHDMMKARDIWRNKMREARAPLLSALDIEVMRASEVGKDLTDIFAKKQALRDVTRDPAIDAAKTPEELKAVWPKMLGVG